MSNRLPEKPEKAAANRGLSLGILVLGTVAVGIAIDLVLPAIPALPDTLGGTTATVQFVLAGYVAGASLGLILLGWLADHVDRRAIFIWSLGAFAAISFACAVAPNIFVLVALRFLQGAVSSGPVVVAPGMVRAMFDDTRAVRVVGLLGSFQSLVPALAPIAGAWLVASFGWAASFFVTGIIAGVSFLFLAARPALLPPGRSGSGAAKGTYFELLLNPGYLRHALGYALVLGGLIVFVFAAPVVIVKGMGGTITGFIVLQVIGVSFFIAAANSSSFVAARIGTERAVLIGTALSALSGFWLLGYGLWGNSPAMLIPPWIVMNAGFGLRGPAGYVAAIAAAGRNDARGSALIGLFLTGVIAGGTALLAPFLEYGLVAAATAVVLIVGSALILLLAMPASPASGAVTSSGDTRS